LIFPPVPLRKTTCTAANLKHEPPSQPMIFNWNFSYRMGDLTYADVAAKISTLLALVTSTRHNENRAVKPVRIPKRADILDTK
jgi:hypothetical protein